MEAAVDRILQLWEGVFEEESWHVPLAAAVQGLTAVQAAWKPSPERHSIWEIVRHVTLWKEYIAGRLAGEPARPAGWAGGVDWPPVTEASPQAWEAAVQQLVDIHQALKRELARRSDEELDAPLPGGKYPLYSLQLMAAHDAYHCGQICYIRALQGIPIKESWD